MTNVAHNVYGAGTLGKNFSNGLDLSDARSSQLVLPEDIIEKYKESVVQQGQYTVQPKIDGGLEFLLTIKIINVNA